MSLQEHMAILFLMRVLRGVQRPAHFLRVAAVLTPADHLRDGLPRKRRAAGHVDQPTEQAGAYFSQPRQHRARLRMTDQITSFMPASSKSAISSEAISSMPSPDVSRPRFAPQPGASSACTWPHAPPVCW